MQSAAAEPMLHEHLREIRSRLLWSVGVFAIGAGGGYIARNQLIAWLQHPLHQRLYYTSPTGSFQFIMQLCMVAGLLIALPVFLYHILRFIEPALGRAFTARMMTVVIICSTLLAIAGAAFAYYVSLPAALHFFATLSPHQLTPLISVNQYFSFVFAYLATFAVVFQLPLILLFIDHTTPINPTKLGGWRKFVFVGAFAIALITPSAPDPLSQIILALPIIVLFEISLILIRVRHHAARPKPVAATPTTPKLTAASKPPTPAKRPTRAIADLRRAQGAPRAQLGSTLDLRSPRKAPLASGEGFWVC